MYIGGLQLEEIVDFGGDLIFLEDIYFDYLIQTIATEGAVQERCDVWLVCWSKVACGTAQWPWTNEI